MKTSDTITSISKALMTFQSKCPTISEDSKGYGYNYAGLPHTVETIKDLLFECGLALTQPVFGDGQEVGVCTILIHSETGEFFQSEISANVSDNKGKGMTPIQAEGSVITYLRRYSLGSMLGIVTDEDNDGGNNGAEENKIDSKNWLNPNTETWNKCVLAIKGGKTTMKAVQDHYKISSENINKLQNEVI